MIIIMRAAKEQMQWQAPFGLLLRGVKCRSYYRNGESFKGSLSVSIRLPRAKWLSHYTTPYDILHACMYVYYVKDFTVRSGFRLDDPPPLHMRLNVYLIGLLARSSLVPF